MAKWNTAGAGVVGGIDKAGGRVHPVTGGAFNGVAFRAIPARWVVVAQARPGTRPQFLTQWMGRL